MPSSIEQKAARIEAIVFDVDGVLTRGDLYYGPDGGEWKVFNSQDGHGLKLARLAGLKVAILTGRASAVVRRRAEELKVDALFEGREDKGIALEQLLTQLGVTAEQACFVGDDLIDIPALRRVGFPVAVANAVAEVKAASVYVTAKHGGEGAAREVVELILKARGEWNDVIQSSLEDP